MLQENTLKCCFVLIWTKQHYSTRSFSPAQWTYAWQRMGGSCFLRDGRCSTAAQTRGRWSSADFLLQLFLRYGDVTWREVGWDTVTWREMRWGGKGRVGWDGRDGRRWNEMEGEKKGLGGVNKSREKGESRESDGWELLIKEREGWGTRELAEKIWSYDICYAAAEFKRRGERLCQFHVKMSMMIIGDDLMRRLRLVSFFESVRFDRISTG